MGNAAHANVQTIYAFLDNWLEEHCAATNAAGNVAGGDRCAVEIKVLRNMVEHAPVLRPDGPKLRGQAAVVEHVMDCGCDKERLRTLAQEFCDKFLVPSE